MNEKLIWNKNTSNDKYRKHHWIKDDGDTSLIDELDIEDEEQVLLADAVIISDFFIESLLNGEMGNA